MALIDPNKHAIVETVDAEVKGNTIIWNKNGENPNLPDKVGTTRDARYQNAVAARSIKLSEDISITYEKSKHRRLAVFFILLAVWHGPWPVHVHVLLLIH